MPVIKCSNGKYRIGSGDCMYHSKASAESAYHGYLANKYGESNMNKARQLLSILTEADHKDNPHIKKLQAEIDALHDEADSLADQGLEDGDPDIVRIEQDIKKLRDKMILARRNLK